LLRGAQFHCVRTKHHFIECLEGGAEFETSGAETLKTMALVYACYRSAEEKRAVSTGEFLTYDAEHALEKVPERASRVADAASVAGVA
jgi:hypothetical protein